MFSVSCSKLKIRLLGFEFPRLTAQAKLEGQVHFLLTSAFVHVAFSKIDFQKFSFRKTRGQTVDTLGLSPRRKPNDEKTRALNAREPETSSNRSR